MSHPKHWDVSLCWTTDDGGFDAADLDRDLIAERLQKDVVRSPSASSAAHVDTAGAHGKAAFEPSGARRSLV